MMKEGGKEGKGFALRVWEDPFVGFFPFLKTMKTEESASKVRIKGGRKEGKSFFAKVRRDLVVNFSSFLKQWKQIKV